MFRHDPALEYEFSALGALPIIGSIVAYLLYLFLDRDRLQSEEFVLTERALQFRDRQGANAEIADATHETIQMEKLPSSFNRRDRR
jgi:hypothetical protein